MLPNIKSPKKANKITMAILMKLLATKIVANSFFGRSKSWNKISTRFDFCSNPASTSLLLRENNATSAPDISAEHTKSKNNNAKLKTTEASIAIIKNIQLAGSGSNYNWFS